LFFFFLCDIFPLPPPPPFFFFFPDFYYFVRASLSPFHKWEPPVKMLPLFLIEGRQWKWGYRLNFAGLLEYSNLQKVAGNSVHTRLPSLGAHTTVDFYQKLNSLFVTEFLNNGLRIRTEPLKGNGSGFSLREFNFLNNLAHQKKLRSVRRLLQATWPRRFYCLKSKKRINALLRLRGPMLSGGYTQK